MMTLEEGETIVGEYKKHWWIIATWAFFLLVIAALPLVLISLMVYFTKFALTTQTVYFVAFCYTVWVSVLWVMFFVEWTDYYLDVWIVTNRRIVDVDQQGLFHKDEATIRLEDVRDIKVEYGGLIQTILNFGTLSVQSSGARTEFQILNVANPKTVEQIIYNYIDIAKKEKFD